jgi:hypothetical protein
MSAMKPSATGQPPASEPVRATKTKAHGDRHFKQVKMPGVASSPILPDWVHNRLSKLFRRKNTPAAR